MTPPSPDDETATTKKKTVIEAVGDQFVETKRLTIEGERLLPATAGELVIQTVELNQASKWLLRPYARWKTPRNDRSRFVSTVALGRRPVWLHLGMLGPKIIGFLMVSLVAASAVSSWTKVTTGMRGRDLVFIDPVSTGYSRPAKDVKEAIFHGYNEDIRSVGQFIQRLHDVV
jgi:carboxypeptidase C (cathepsin A)